MEDTYTMFVEKTKSFSIDIFGYRIMVVLTSSIPASINKHRNLFPDGCILDLEDAHALHIRHPHKAFSMILLPFEAASDYIVHEAYHATRRIVDWVSSDCEELTAYVLGYITGKIVEFSNKTGTPKIPKIPKRIIKKIQNRKKDLDKGKRIVVS